MEEPEPTPGTVTLFVPSDSAACWAVPNTNAPFLIPKGEDQLGNIQLQWKMGWHCIIFERQQLQIN